MPRIISVANVATTQARTTQLLHTAGYAIVAVGDRLERALRIAHREHATLPVRAWGSSWAIGTTAGMR
jgi:hypothetical protein